MHPPCVMQGTTVTGPYITPDLSRDGKGVTHQGAHNMTQAETPAQRLNRLQREYERITDQWAQGLTTDYEWWLKVTDLFASNPLPKDED